MKFLLTIFAKSTLIFITFLFVYTGYSQSCSSGCSVSVTALNASSPSTITLNNGEVLCVRASTSRTINIVGNNVTICVASTATLSSNITFGGSAANLTITNFGTFTSNLNGGLPTNTIITNSGTWSGSINTNFTGASSSITNSGTWSGSLNGIFSGGTLTNTGSWSGIISSITAGVITNTGAWNQPISSFSGGVFNNNSGGSFNANLTLSGSSVFNHNIGASFTSSSTSISIQSGSTFNNYTTLNKPFTIDGGTFINQSTGSINTVVTFNSGTFTNNGSATITNNPFNINGTFTSASGSTLNFTNGVTINTASLSVASNVNFQVGGNFINNSTFSTASNVTIGGTFTNNSGVVTVSGAQVTVNGTGTSRSSATINVTNGAFVTKGPLENNSGTINLNNSVVDITGTLVSSGTITNTGTGCVSVKVSGTSTNTGTFGTSGSASTPKTDICTANSTGFTTNFGTLNNATTCSCSITPLPVTFISFTGVALQETVVLKWQTSVEENNKGFEIERSRDGKSFEWIAEVAGKGTTKELSSYQFTDADPLSGYNYYRIKQVDLDGTESYYSKVVAVRMTARESRVMLAPNPASSSQVSVRMAAVPPSLTLTVIDMKGAIRLTQEYTQPQAENILSVQNLEKGVYLIQVQAGNQVETIRLVRL